MGMSEWAIITRWATRAECESQSTPAYDVGAFTSWFPDTSSATISINPRITQDFYHTVIHELLHLRLEGHKMPRISLDAMYERGLNYVATLLKDTYDRRANGSS